MEIVRLGAFSRCGLFRSLMIDREKLLLWKLCLTFEWGILWYYFIDKKLYHNLSPCRKFANLIIRPKLQLNIIELKNVLSKVTTWMLDWVQCDGCKKWFHTFHRGVEASLEEYICKFFTQKETIVCLWIIAFL